MGSKLKEASTSARNLDTLSNKHLTTYSCSMSSDDELCDTIWAVYNEAVGVQERKRYPVIGPSVDKRAFAYTASMQNGKRTHAYMCFVCSAITPAGYDQTYR